MGHLYHGYVTNNQWVVRGFHGFPKIVGGNNGTTMVNYHGNVYSRNDGNIRFHYIHIIPSVG